MLSTIDNYSGFIDNGSNNNSISLKGEYEGLGIGVLNNSDGNIVIATVYNDSPAYKVGIKVGDIVNVNTIIGQQGGGSKTRRWESCSTGSHLHFGVVEGYIKTKYMATYFNNNAIVPPGYPNKGAWFYSRTQWFD